MGKYALAVSVLKEKVVLDCAIHLEKAIAELPADRSRVARNLVKKILDDANEVVVVSRDEVYNLVRKRKRLGITGA